VAQLITNVATNTRTHNYTILGMLKMGVAQTHKGLLSIILATQEQNIQTKI